MQHTNNITFVFVFVFKRKLDTREDILKGKNLGKKCNIQIITITFHPTKQHEKQKQNDS